MTVPSEVSRVHYDGDNVSTVFPVPFRFLADAHLKVIRVDGEEETVLALNANYTVTGAGNDGGGSVVLAAPLGVGPRLVILQNPPVTQLADYEANARFPAAGHEWALDKAAHIDQRTRDLVERALRLKDGDLDGSGGYRARGNRIVDLEDGEDDNDAANVGQIKDLESRIGLRGTTVVTLLAASALTSLPALASLLTEHTAVSLAGYHEANDGGGGTLHYEPWSNETADQGSVIEIPGITGRFKRVINGPRVSAMAFGVHGDGPSTVDLSLSLADQANISGTDDSAALRKAFDFCRNFPGMTLELPGRCLMVDDPSFLAFPPHTSVVGVPGKTIIDTRRRPDFTDESDYQFGTRGVKRDDLARSLTHDTKTPLNLPVSVASATHSAGIITIGTATPHGLSVGELIYHEGNPSFYEGYAGYFHVTNRSVGRSVPGVILSVPNSTTLTFAATSAVDGAHGTLIAALVPGAFVTRASDVLRVSNTAGLKVGDRFILGSQALHRSGVSEQQRIGEQQIVALILNETMIRLPVPVREDYLVSDQAKVVPVEFAEGVHVEGITFVGKGADVRPGFGNRGDRGLEFRHVLNGSLKNCQVLHFDLIGHFAHGCVNYDVENLLVINDFKDTGGRSSGSIDVVYCLTYGMACQNVKYKGCVTIGGRHGISQNGSSDPLDYGVSRDIWIDKCILTGSFIAACSTHQAVEGLRITHCATDSADCINIRFARDVQIIGGYHRAWRETVQITNHFGNLIISGATFDAGGACVRIGSMQAAWLDPPEDRDRILRITNNTFLRGTNCVSARTSACASWLRTYIEVRGNTSRNITRTPYSFQLGSLVYSGTTVPADNSTRTFVVPFSIDHPSNITVTLDGSPVVGWTPTLEPEPGEDEGSGSISRITIPGSYGDLTGRTLGWSRSTRDGWSGDIVWNTHQVSEHEASANIVELWNPRDVNVDDNKLRNEAGITTKYANAVYIRGDGSTKTRIGRNEGFRENATRLFYLFNGTPGIHRPEGLLPEIQRVDATANFTWFRVAQNQDGFARTIELDAAPSGEQVITLNDPHAIDGDMVRFVRLGDAGAGTQTFKNAGGTTLLSGFAADQNVEFRSRDGQWRAHRRGARI